MTSNEPREPPAVIGFWSWLICRDVEGDRGISNILNKYLVIHILVAGVLALIANDSATSIAKSIALPGAAILVGLSFAWAGRSANLLQDREFSAFLIENGPPAEGYVYSFQLAILAVIVFILVALALAAGGLNMSLGTRTTDEFANRFVLFFFGSLALRECWGVILFVNKLTIQYYRFREMDQRRS
jgi:hypothetical protein